MYLSSGLVEVWLVKLERKQLKEYILNKYKHECGYWVQRQEQQSSVKLLPMRQVFVKSLPWQEIFFISSNNSKTYNIQRLNEHH